MNRNTEQHFSSLPAIEQKRSRFDLSHSHKTSWSNGDIIPIYTDTDISPGDSFNVTMSDIIRTTTPIVPVMDNLFADIYWFFVPHRLTWEHWEEFWGQNDDPWASNMDYEVPQINAPEGGWTAGTIADYMGIPTNVDGFSVDSLAFRAYVKIWNDFFRDENLKQAAHLYVDDTTRNGQNGTEQGYSYITGAELGGKPLKAAKFHDYFTSCLPQPQKGPEVTIPLGEWAPVGARWADGYPTYEEPIISSVNPYPSVVDGTGNPIGYERIVQGQPVIGIHSRGSVIQETNPKASTLAEGRIGTDVSDNRFNETSSYLGFNNLWTDLSTATAATINNLRTAFAVQKFYEAQARYGSRYVEFLHSIFGVTTSDGRLQRAEYLGGQRIPLNMDQVLQTSSTDATSPQGNASGFSCTVNRDDDMFTKSFEEHGTLICCIVTRHDNTYQQGLERMWSRRKWIDFMNPFFSHLGEQSVKNKELYLQGTSADDEVFGYQERYAEYRYKQNHVSGMLRSNYAQSLDIYHYADDYESQPYLSSEWIDEGYANVDRTLAVSSSLVNQFIGDFYFNMKATRVLPVYGIPGLIDHV